MSRENWYVPPGLQLTRLASAFVDKNFLSFNRRDTPDGSEIELRLSGVGPLYLIKGVDFDKEVEEILNNRRSKKDVPLMKKRQLQSNHQPWKEITYSHEDLDRTIVTITMPGGENIDIRIKDGELMMSSYGKALVVSPRAANQITIGFKDPYERD